jgi:hypothetical protein
MGFIDNDSKFAATVFGADLIEDEREFLDRGDDDLLTTFDEPAQVSGVFGMATVDPTWANCLMVSRICWSRIRRSVTTMMESNISELSFLRPMS